MQAFWTQIGVSQLVAGGTPLLLIVMRTVIDRFYTNPVTIAPYDH